jgi:hypothetical protein
VLLPVAAAVLVGGTLALLGAFGGEDGTGGETQNEVDEQAQAQIEETRAKLTETLRDKRQGISAQFPKTWRSTKPRGERLLESRDRCMAIKLSAPATAAQAGRLRRDTIAALRKGIKDIQVAPGEQSKQIGGIPTRQDVITVGHRGRQVRILVAVGTGRKLAYLTEFVLRDPSCGRTLLEAQLILGSIRYSN